MKQIYLSGPMTGLPELNFPAFHSAAQKLRGLGYVVTNPAELDHDPNSSWQKCMRNDLKAMLDCDVLVLLEGWERSSGAHLEVHIAHRIGMEIIFCKDLLGLHQKYNNI